MRKQDRMVIYLLKEKVILKKDIKKYQRLEGQVKTKKGVRKKVYVEKKKRIPALKERQDTLTRSNTYRYSIAYFNSYTRKTFRAEVYTLGERNEDAIKRQLDNNLNNWVNAKNNASFTALYRNTTYIGFEAEPVGSNDVGASELNRIRCFFE
jgi:hypothetical protein